MEITDGSKMAQKNLHKRQVTDQTIHLQQGNPSGKFFYLHIIKLNWRCPAKYFHIDF